MVERFGKYSRTLTPGLHVLIPIVDRIAYAHSLKETTIPVPNQVRGLGGQQLHGWGGSSRWRGQLCKRWRAAGWRRAPPMDGCHLSISAPPSPCIQRRQTAITKDNVSLTIDGVLYVKVRWAGGPAAASGRRWRLPLPRRGSQPRLAGDPQKGD